MERNDYNSKTRVNLDHQNSIYTLARFSNYKITKQIILTRIVIALEAA